MKINCSKYQITMTAAFYSQKQYKMLNYWELYRHIYRLIVKNSNSRVQEQN